MCDSHGFKLLYEVQADGEIPIVKYKSENTGVTVFIAQVEGPLVNGYFCLATEAHDDDGLPHTLEHLIFLGSELYPYKGVLDLLANRCLASGTNAWTDTDHTCYTMTNAGSEGFLNLLPIYMDHILYPTLTESGYVTEVHHVNGEGEDAGVVYCEMQGRENTGESRCHLAMVRAMYPGHCGYKSETGGIMLNLRESTSHVKVCNYHKAFYRPENLCLVITGQVKPEDVFAALQPVEQRIMGKGDRGSFGRPWQSPVPPISGLHKQVMLYPADEETHGMVHTAWRGPMAKDQYKYHSVLVLQDYLSESAISPLQKAFVEIDDPYCSQVYGSMIENSECCVFFVFQNVEKEKLQDIHTKLNEVLHSTLTEKMDMTRMDSLIHRKILEALNSAEDNPHDTMTGIVIGDFLYGGDKADLEARTHNITMFKKMKEEPEQYWKDVLSEFFISKPEVIIIGEPSKKLMEDMGQEEKDRVAEQQKKLGEEGLKKKSDVLEAATEENEKEAPSSMLTCVKVPDVSSISFHPLQPSCNLDMSAANKNSKFPLAEIPFRFQLDDIKTNFVQINALLDSTAVAMEMKYYLPLFCEVLFESPLMRNGELVSHEDVIKQLQADTLHAEGAVGINGRPFSCGQFPQLIHLELKVEQEKYEKGVQWLKDLLYNTKFTSERLKIITQRKANDIAALKRKGMGVTKTLMRELLYVKDCNQTVCSMLRQEKFLRDLQTKLENSPDEVVNNMETIRQTLVHPSNLRIHMSANVKGLTSDMTSPQLPWLQFLNQEQAKESSSVVSMKKTFEYIMPFSASEDKLYLVGVGSVESAFLIQATPSVKSFEHEDLPAILVFTQYLTQLEGPLWKQIRGLGLAYHYSIYSDIETGLLYFLLFKSSHIVNAYKEARDIVHGYIVGKTPFSEVELESARSSLIFEIIEKEKTVSSVSHESMLSYFKGITQNYNKELLPKIAKVTIPDLQRIGTKYITPLFDTTQIKTAVCCHPSKVKEVTEEFKGLGLEFKVLPSIEEDFLCKY